jgi:hypothetical protein
MFCAPSNNVEIPRLSARNTSQKMFIGNITISEIVIDSDLDGGNISDFSDSDTCKLHSPCSCSSSGSSNEEKVVIQNLTDAGRGHAVPLLNGQIQILS